MELLRDVTASALVLAIQVGMPVGILFLIGYATYQSDQERRPFADGRAGTGGPTGRRAARAPAEPRPRELCWLVRGCSIEKRGSCPVHRRAEIACWQAVKQATGHLQPSCLDCPQFP